MTGLHPGVLEMEGLVLHACLEPLDPHLQRPEGWAYLVSLPLQKLEVGRWLTALVAGLGGPHPGSKVASQSGHCIT